jgi:hypothetical protein
MNRWRVDKVAKVSLIKKSWFWASSSGGKSRRFPKEQCGQGVRSGVVTGKIVSIDKMAPYEPYLIYISSSLNKHHLISPSL